MLAVDERYRATDGSFVSVPSSESLKDTHDRITEFWEDTLAPALRDGKNVLVVSHGNTLRALVKLLDGVSEDESFHLDLPTACPVIYELDKDLKPSAAPEGFWGVSDTPRYGRFLMSEKKVRQAQDAMRQQCVKNIAVSTVRLHGMDDPDAISTCDAYTASSSSQQLVTLNGLSFNVRERPPSYFALESERIKRQAQDEISSMLAHMTREVNEVAASSSAADDVTPPPPAAAAMPRCTLILLRHGYSVYNAQNRFTGWADVELSNRGREEARFAGSLLREAGVRRLEKVYSSFLKRAIKTAWLMLDELELQWVPIQYSWRLNERHYGALQGRRKHACAEEFGVKKVQMWRRGVHQPPPPWDAMHKTETVDRRYTGVDVPETESLADCAARVRPFLDEMLRPDMRTAIDAADAAAAAGAEQAQQQQAVRTPEPVANGRRGKSKGQSNGVSMVAPTASHHSSSASTGSGPPGAPTFVISSSENLIRALVAELEGLDDDEVPLLDIPYATPLVYQFDAELNPLPSTLAAAPLKHGYYLGDAERIREVQRDIRESLVCESIPGEDGDAPPCDVLLDPEDTCFALDGDDEKWTCGEESVVEGRGGRQEE